MATEDEVLLLRQMVNEEDDCNGYDDATLGAAIDSSTSLNAAASSIWYLKAGRFSTMVDVSESGSSRKLGDLLKNAQAMGKLYADMDVPAEEEASGPVIQRIRRTIG